MWETVQEAGEIVFVPSSCAHVVLTLEASVAVSVDLVNDANLHLVSSHLSALVRGC
jgi:hypothetical protein